jgi:hypothetical protein
MLLLLASVVSFFYLGDIVEGLLTDVVGESSSLLSGAG